MKPRNTTQRGETMIINARTRKYLINQVNLQGKRAMISYLDNALYGANRSQTAYIAHLEASIKFVLALDVSK